MEVEDHPLDYASFECVIEEGSYGAGPVIVWDAGSYRNLSERRGEEVPIEQALRDGHASVWLEGRKLQGGWSLRRIRHGAKPQWLLIKRRDAGADARRRPTSTQPESVLSGRTIEELVRSAGSGADPESPGGRADQPPEPAAPGRGPSALRGDEAGAHRRAVLGC